MYALQESGIAPAYEASPRTWDAHRQFGLLLAGIVNVALWLLMLAAGCLALGVTVSAPVVVGLTALLGALTGAAIAAAACVRAPGREFPA